jgi:hypothetical protein
VACCVDFYYFKYRGGGGVSLLTCLKYEGTDRPVPSHLIVYILALSASNPPAEDEFVRVPCWLVGRVVLGFCFCAFSVVPVFVLFCHCPFHPTAPFVPCFPPGGSTKFAFYILTAHSPISLPRPSAKRFLSLTRTLTTFVSSHRTQGPFHTHTLIHHRHNGSFTPSQLLPCCPAGHGQQPTR